MNIESEIKSTIALDINTKTVINILFTSKYIEESFLSVLKPFDLSSQQYNVLRILRGQKGKPANLCTLQERMIDKSSNTTRLVDKLIQKKLASRQICEANRRKVEIFITEKGLELLNKLDPITKQKNKEILNHLNQNELEVLNSSLDTIRTI
ncbi:MAG: DNA-binding MarR family transcriptional regulator [Flavobacteriaceae bacterium]|jgi:DNA-binding MarR family transcriptional regulator|uniref:MarR family winged helix-turn-helix transcriptional regulator n=1 Tax=Candidatus Marifrigoribacter sp. Uisw_064 TaxID=3230970 RepID=UPI003AEF0AA0